MKKIATTIILLSLSTSLFALNPRDADAIVKKVYDDYVTGAVVLGILPIIGPFSGFADMPIKNAVVTWHDVIKGNEKLVQQVKDISPTMYDFLIEREMSGLYQKYYQKQ